MVMSVTIDNEFRVVVEKRRFVQRMLREGKFLFRHLVANPNDDLVQGLEGGALGYFDHEFHRIDHVELEGLILFTNIGVFEELIADIVPYFFEFNFQRGGSSMAFDLPTNP